MVVHHFSGVVLFKKEKEKLVKLHYLFVIGAIKPYIRLLPIKSKKHSYRVAIITQLYLLLFIVYQEESSVPTACIFVFVNIISINYSVCIGIKLLGRIVFSS